jgi:hypothetical protein
VDLEQTVELCCPYCGEVFTTFIDTSQGSFSTIEDCQVCCRPMQINVECAAGEIAFVDVQRA